MTLGKLLSFLSFGFSIKTENTLNFWYFYCLWMSKTFLQSLLSHPMRNITIYRDLFYRLAPIKQASVFLQHRLKSGKSKGKGPGQRESQVIHFSHNSLPASILRGQCHIIFLSFFQDQKLIFSDLVKS